MDEKKEAPAIEAYAAYRQQVGGCNACHYEGDNVAVIRLRTMEIRLCHRCKVDLTDRLRAIRL